MDPNAIPQLTRVATTGAYDSTGNSTVISNLAGNAPRNHYLISFLANVERTIGWQTGAITGKGAFIYLSNNLVAADAVIAGMVIEQSFDSSNYVDGTWAAITWAPWKAPLVATSNAYMQVGQIIPIPAGAARKIRVKVNNTTGTNISIRFGLMQRPAAGIPDDVVCLTGPSLMSPTTSRSGIDALNAATGNQFDPVVIMAAEPGMKSDQVATMLSGAMDKYPDYIASAFADHGGNDPTSGRPYATDATRGATLAGIITSFNKLAQYVQAKFGLQNLTYRNYPDGGVGKPAVNVYANPENGSGPYNTQSIDPWMATNMPDLWEPNLGIPRIDAYSVIAYTYDTSLQADGIHLLNPAGNDVYRFEWARFYAWRKGLGWTPTYVERTIAAFETAGTITADKKTRLQFCMNEWPPVQNAGQTTARNALAARLNAITVSG